MQHSTDGYIIDAGWYKSKTSDWEQSHGDWQVDMMRFPGGFKPVVEEIHQQGMEAGLWFEMETVGRLSEKFQDTESLVQETGML
ncbi:alpha-galactosidase [Enterococcus sp.]|uniref:alpha-galactosidase n=1 Tax=Enterococcus sp. TaxID=35783 RepID=UPI0039950946